MKVRFYCNNGANIHSKYFDEFDTEADLDLTDDAWKALPEEEKNKVVQEWALERYEYWYEEVE